MVRVSLINGRTRHDNIGEALKLTQSDIEPASKERILLKPHLVHRGSRAAVTHVNAVRAVLDFLTDREVVRVQIAEGSGTMDRMRAFRNAGYGDWQRSMT
jgi:uncharacterized protein (DUF362 family)